MFRNLRIEMYVRNLTYEKLATRIGMSESTLAKKVKGITDFKSEEMFKIRDTVFPDLTLEYLFAKTETK